MEANNYVFRQLKRLPRTTFIGFIYSRRAFHIDELLHTQRVTMRNFDWRSLDDYYVRQFDTNAVSSILKMPSPFVLRGRKPLLILCTSSLLVVLTVNALQVTTMSIFSLGRENSRSQKERYVYMLCLRVRESDFSSDDD